MIDGFFYNMDKIIKKNKKNKKKKREKINRNLYIKENIDETVLCSHFQV